MFDLERWEEIFEAIGKNKLRTFLTGISVLSGIFILVVLLGVGQGIQNGISEQFEKDAENRIDIWPGITSLDYKGLNKNRRIQLKNKDYEQLKIKYGDFMEYKSSLYRIWSSFITYKEQSGSFRVEGVYPDYQMLENEKMLEGRYINQMDLRNDAKVAVIGNKAKGDLFGNDSPLDEYIQISGINFKIIGVFTDAGGDREEERVFLPITTAQKVFNAGDNIRNIAFTIPQMGSFDEALALSNELTDRIRTQLQERHTVHPNDISAINFNNTLEGAERFYVMTKSIKIFFWFVGIATLLAGVIGVSNVMLIIVKERTKEIGIRKALGAKPWSIIQMILHEAVFITAVAGFLGLFLGMVLLDFAGPYINSDFMKNPDVNFNIAVITTVILIVAGGLAGFFPAWQAAKIKPIEALRSD